MVHPNLTVRGILEMPDFVPIARVSDIPQGQSASFTVNDRMVAIFHSVDRFYAIDDLCPHMGASLAEGHFENDIVTCPWHAWCFSVCDGTWCDNPKLGVATYELRIEDDQILICIPSES